jgi:pimeloyl-ACP methyl ester carboxylesterase
MPPIVTTPAGFARETHDINGTETVLLVGGCGPALVILHGTGTFPGFAFAKDLARTYRVLIPFHANFGESGDNPAIATVEDHVLHYMDLFDRLGLERFILCGFSFGGWLAAAFAIRQPQRIAKLVLAAPAGLRVDSALPPNLFDMSPQEVPAYLTYDPMVAVSYFPKISDPNFDAQLGREMRGLARALENAPDGDPVLARWGHRITMHTLLLWGAEDRLVPVAQALHWEKLLPNSLIAYVPGAGHLLFEERPEDSLRALRDFLDT